MANEVFPFIKSGLSNKANMSFSKYQTSDTLKTYNSTSYNTKIKQIRKMLRELEKTEISKFKSLKIKIYKEDEIEKVNNRIIIPPIYKYDYNKNINNNIKSELPKADENYSDDQINSSDLVNSD